MAIQDNSVRRRDLATYQTMLEAFIGDPRRKVNRAVIADFIEESSLGISHQVERQFFLASLSRPYRLRVGGAWKSRRGTLTAVFGAVQDIRRSYVWCSVNVKSLPDAVFAALLGNDSRNAAQLVRVQDLLARDLGLRRRRVDRLPPGVVRDVEHSGGRWVLPGEEWYRAAS